MTKKIVYSPYDYSISPVMYVTLCYKYREWFYAFFAINKECKEQFEAAVEAAQTPSEMEEVRIQYTVEV